MAITRIHTNIAALTASRHVGNVGNNLSKSMERLASGLRINRASDDAAGQMIATRLGTQIRGLQKAIENAQDGGNLIATAEGALAETTVRLNRMREIAVQAANTGVNDAASRQALQDEVFQSIDEITRIAKTTQFGGNVLLNGDFSIKSTIRAGQDQYGIHIDPSPIASTLRNGTSFLSIVKLQNGSNQIVAGETPAEPQVVNLGIKNQSDIAVSLGRWTTDITIDGGSALTTTSLAVAFFQGVSLHSADTIVFTGVLADGVQRFTGQISVTGSAGLNTLAALLTAINDAVVAAEEAFFGVAIADVPDSFQITAALGTGANAGRIVLRNTTNTFSQASIDFTVNATRAGGSGAIVAQSIGVTRATIGADSILSGSGQIGNSVVAITGSTFDTGSFTITVEDVIGAQPRITEGAIAFRDDTGTLLGRAASLTNAVINGSFVNSIYTGGITLKANSTITLIGTEADGTTFQGIYTLDGTLTPATDTDYNDFAFATLTGLIEELNYRTRVYAGAPPNAVDGDITRFSLSQFTLTNSGTIALVDDIAKTGSQTTFTLTFLQDTTNHVTLQDDATLVQDGFAESATVSVNGGARVRVEAGQVVTLYGPESTVAGVATPQVTLRIGSGLTPGTDRLETVEQVFEGRVNGGVATTFRNGDQDVTFVDPDNKQLSVDFDAILDVTKATSGTNTGTTVLISTVNRSISFQVGAFAGQNFQASLGDLRADNLGFGRGSGRTIADIDITTLSGANEAMRIIDEALDQVNSTRSLLGAATNRLESTVASLTITAENLTASQSRIQDADIAAESTRFALNQILMQAGISVLAQANFQNQTLLSLIGV
jgi:flagellin